LSFSMSSVIEKLLYSSSLCSGYSSAPQPHVHISPVCLSLLLGSLSHSVFEFVSLPRPCSISFSLPVFLATMFESLSLSSPFPYMLPYIHYIERVQSLYSFSSLLVFHAFCATFHRVHSPFSSPSLELFRFEYLARFHIRERSSFSFALLRACFIFINVHDVNAALNTPSSFVEFLPLVVAFIYCSYHITCPVFWVFRHFSSFPLFFPQPSLDCYRHSYFIWLYTARFLSQFLPYCIR